MKRPTTLALFALALIAGGVVFGVAFKVSALEERLAELNKEITQDRNAIHVLRAEWAYLNQPERLEGLSQRYLDLNPLGGEQLSEADTVSLPVREIPEPTVEEAGATQPVVAEQEPAEPVLVGLFTGVPKVKPAAPRRPKPSVQLAVQPAARKPAKPEGELDAVLRSVLGDAYIRRVSQPDSGNAGAPR